MAQAAAAVESSKDDELKSIIEGINTICLESAKGKGLAQLFNLKCIDVFSSRAFHRIPRNSVGLQVVGKNIPSFYNHGRPRMAKRAALEDIPLVVNGQKTSLGEYFKSIGATPARMAQLHSQVAFVPFRKDITVNVFRKRSSRELVILASNYGVLTTISSGNHVKFELEGTEIRGKQDTLMVIRVPLKGDSTPVWTGKVPLPNGMYWQADLYQDAVPGSVPVSTNATNFLQQAMQGKFRGGLDSFQPKPSVEKTDSSVITESIEELRAMPPTCKCGCPLVKVLAKNAYQGVVICDGSTCGERHFKGTEWCWHCPKGNCDDHRGGYDLCDQCIDAKKEIQWNDKFPIHVTFIHLKAVDAETPPIVDTDLMASIAGTLESSLKVETIKNLWSDARPAFRMAPKKAMDVIESDSKEVEEIPKDDDGCDWTVVDGESPVDVDDVESLPETDGYDIVRTILELAGGSEYISTYLDAFKREELDDDALFCLESSDDLKSGNILVKTGPRVKFWKALTLYKAQNQRD